MRPALAAARGTRRCGAQPRRRLHQAGPGARYAMSVLLRPVSDAHPVTAAQHALVQPCAGPGDLRFTGRLALAGPAGPDGVDAQVGCHGRRTAVKCPVQERFIVAELLRWRGQPVVFQPPAFDRQRFTERGPGLVAAVPAGDPARLGDQPGVAVVLRAEVIGLRAPVLLAEPFDPAGDLRAAVRIAAGTAHYRPAVELGRDEHMREVARPSGRRADSLREPGEAAPLPSSP